MTLSTRVSFVRILTLFVATSCSSASGPLWEPILKVDAGSYGSGGLIDATLINSSGDALLFGACPFDLERRIGATWTPVPEPDVDCDGSLHSLPSGRASTMVFRLFDTLESGTYRLVMGVRLDDDRDGPQVRLESRSFTVRAPS